MVIKSKAHVHRNTYQLYWLYYYYQQYYTCTCRRQVVPLPRAHPMLTSVILHLLFAQLAWTLTVVNLMQLKSYCPFTREITEQTDRDIGPSKRCKYDENYIDLGFTYFESSAFPQPRCVKFAKVLSHNSMKPSLLCRHFRNKTCQFQK